MLEKVWIVITEEGGKTAEQAKRLKKRLQSEGLEAGMEPFFSDSRKPQPAAGELYLTDCPEAVGRLAGENCRILLYLTEKSRKLSMTEYPYAVEDLEEIDAGYLEGIYRRLAGEPWEILRTKRLLVREQREEDLDSLYEIYAHPDMTAYMEGLAVDREEERERLRSYIRTVYPLYGFGLWMLEKRNGDCIGRAGFFWREEAKLPELGFAIKKSEQGQGYCLEACRAILKYGFVELEFSGVQALTREENRAAEAVLMRLGFQRCGVTQADGKKAVRWILLRSQVPSSELKEGGEKPAPQWKGEDPCGIPDRSVWEEPAP